MCSPLSFEKAIQVVGIEFNDVLDVFCWNRRGEIGVEFDLAVQERGLRVFAFKEGNATTQNDLSSSQTVERIL